MRAVTVEGGSGNRIEKQLAEHCDSGVVVEGGADETTIADSWFHDCRVGWFFWGTGTLELRENAISAPREHAVVSDRADIDLAGNSVDGDTWVASG